MQKQRTLFQRFYLFLIGVLGCASAAVIVWQASHEAVPPLWLFLVVTVLVVVLDLGIVRLETSNPDSPVFVSTGAGIFIFSVVTLGAYGLLPVALGEIVARWITRRWRQPLGYYFNVCQSATSFLMMLAITPPLRSNPSFATPSPAVWLSLIGVLLVHPAFSLLFMSLLTSVGSRQPVREIFTSTYLPTAWVGVIPLSLGLLGALILPLAPLLALLVLLPFVLAYRALVSIAGWLDATKQLRDANEQLEQRVEERTQALKRAERNREREVGDAVHDLGHELRTIETAFLRSGTDDKERQLLFQPARDLLNDMLLASQLREDALELHPAVTDLSVLLADVMSQLYPVFQQADCVLHIDLPDADSVLAWCDGARISRVLKNIIHNALIYTLNYKAQAHVSIALTVSGTLVSCTVVDDGPGMTSADIAQLGERFVRLQSGAERPDGVGIGLSFCARLLALSNGSLSIESDGLGYGTAVTVTLPRVFEYQQHHNESSNATAIQLAALAGLGA